jgi:hypothetical protein
MKRGVQIDGVRKNDKRRCQAAGGARGICGPLAAGRTADSIADAGVGARVCVSTSATVACGGPSSAWPQHCVPQPAAQGHPVAWLPDGCEPSADAAQRLEENEAPAATDSGSSSACSATT